MLSLLGRLADREGLAIAFTTASAQSCALAVADKVLVDARHRQELFSGTADEVMTETNLEALYGISVRSTKLGNGEREETAFGAAFSGKGMERKSQ